MKFFGISADAEERPTVDRFITALTIDDIADVGTDERLCEPTLLNLV